jgi:hypothetical protein
LEHKTLTLNNVQQEALLRAHRKLKKTCPDAFAFHREEQEDGSWLVTTEFGFAASMLVEKEPADPEAVLHMGELNLLLMALTYMGVLEPKEEKLGVVVPLRNGKRLDA